MDSDGAPVGQAPPRGSVFINYRSKDQPVAAAAIHDALVRRFGEDRVFLDCVSMKAGQHYPSTIRAALESASVLVAVVGPRWLTLTDPQTSVRLIDRDDDWVRLEIAFALRRGIAVVPVLLKDTPEHAVAPSSDELPDDLRLFATLQAFDFSQRRFGSDLDRLTERLLQLHPALAARRPVNGAGPIDPFVEFVEALLDVPCVQNAGSRSLLLSLIRRDIATVIPHHPSDRLHVIAIVQTCMRYRDGLTDLINAALTLGMNPELLPRLCTLASRLSSPMTIN